MWSFVDFYSYSHADFAGRVIPLIDDTTEFCISSDTVENLNASGNVPPYAYFSH